MEEDVIVWTNRDLIDRVPYEICTRRNPIGCSVRRDRINYRTTNAKATARCSLKRKADDVQGVLSKLMGLDIEPTDYEYLRYRIEKLKQNFDQDRSKEIESVEIQLAQIKDRLSRLTDAYLDNAIDRETFEQKKTALLMERRAIEDKIKDLRNGSPELPKRLDHLLELLKSPYSQYISGSPTEKRDLVQETFSNRTLREKTLEISLAVPFTEVAVCVENTSGGPSRKNARTWDRLADFLFQFFLTGQDNSV